MHITIDTTQPLTFLERALLETLLRSPGPITDPGEGDPWADRPGDPGTATVTEPTGTRKTRAKAGTTAAKLDAVETVPDEIADDAQGDYLDILREQAVSRATELLADSQADKVRAALTAAGGARKVSELADDQLQKFVDALA
jgi:hypothetical protein